MGKGVLIGSGFALTEEKISQVFAKGYSFCDHPPVYSVRKSMSRYIKQLLIALALLILLTGCGSNLQNEQFTPLILDEAGILSQETLNWLRDYNYPKGFAFIVRTVNALPQGVEVGSRANEYFETDANRCPNSNACEKRGVYIILSREPALIQVRAGSEIAAQLRWKGITAGATYIQKQSVVSSGNFDGGLRGMIEWLSSSIPQAVKLPWYKKWLLNDITQSLWLELDHLSLPSEGFYGNYILRPFVQARVIESQFVGTWWLTYVVAALVVFVFKAIVQALVNFAFGRLSLVVANGINLVLAITFHVSFVVPSAASVILLSGSRLEDRIALQAWGIPGISNFSFSAELFNVETGFLLALLVLVIRWINGIGGSAEIIGLSFLSEEKQQITFETIKEKDPLAALMLEGYVTNDEMFGSIIGIGFTQAPFSAISAKMVWDVFKAGIRWGLLSWLFLPKALSLAMVYIWIPPMVIGFFKLLITVKRVSQL